MQRFWAAILTTLVCALFCEAQQQHLNNNIYGQPSVFRKTRQNDEETTTVVAVIAPAAASSGTEPCAADYCNNRGTCFGTKMMPFCFCQLGSTGARCQDNLCDSTRDCNGRGFCMGTQHQSMCLCSLGWTGAHCEIQTTPTSAPTLPPPPPPAAVSRANEPVDRFASEPADRAERYVNNIDDDHV